jgi:crotonobetainyl-CoA:carnitine CoA-transferase CaiB-like acyl-CoA transferase
MGKAGRPDLVDDPRFKDAAARATNKLECIGVLDALFAGKTFDEWKALLADVEGIWAPVQTVSEVVEDPQVVANGYVRDVVAQDGSTFKLVATPVQFDESPPNIVRAPAHGEHTDAILDELGLDMDQIIDLKIKGAVL